MNVFILVGLSWVVPFDAFDLSGSASERSGGRDQDVMIVERTTTLDALERLYDRGGTAAQAPRPGVSQDPWASLKPEMRDGDRLSEVKTRIRVGADAFVVEHVVRLMRGDVIIASTRIARAHCRGNSEECLIK